MKELFLTLLISLENDRRAIAPIDRSPQKKYHRFRKALGKPYLGFPSEI